MPKNKGKVRPGAGFGLGGAAPPRPRGHEAMDFRDHPS